MTAYAINCMGKLLIISIFISFCKVKLFLLFKNFNVVCIIQYFSELKMFRIIIVIVIINDDDDF